MSKVFPLKVNMRVLSASLETLSEAVEFFFATSQLRTLVTN